MSQQLFHSYFQRKKQQSAMFHCNKTGGGSRMFPNIDGAQEILPGHASGGRPNWRISHPKQMLPRKSFMLSRGIDLENAVA